MSNYTDISLDERCEQAVALRQEGQYDEARRAFEGILAEDPDHRLARLELGLVELFTGEFDAGRETLEEVVRREPEWFEARVHLAKTYAMVGRNEDACREFLTVVKRAPEDSLPHVEAKKQLTYFPSDLIESVRHPPD